ncbi:MAG: 50S ribosomal protein L23 [Bacteroidales bacterium]|jgi:large subunit ribosomal protein L23|nr:50S ribosomal protein L23 [Bacteroidales bacterium]MBR4453655.1 50S ribosomal protein L23 [Bacteroidales bacterium]MCR5555662.1 50S ribosomal protein L23 [Bacteroidales bacterium]
MNVIIKPIVTEKMTALSEKYNRYGFVVDRRADKLQIKKAVEDMYGVKVDSVNTLIQRGKDTSRYTKAGMIKGKKSSFKKAIVQLKEGDQIDFYSGI